MPIVGHIVQEFGSVRTQDTAGNLPRKWGMLLSKRAERGENTRTEVPFWRESGECSRPFFNRVPSSDRTALDGLGHLWVGGMHQISHLAAHLLLPARERLNVVIDAGVGLVGTHAMMIPRIQVLLLG